MYPASIGPERVNVPMHFPCADRVKMPQLGSEDTEFKISKPSPRSTMMLYRTTDLSQHEVPKAYIRQISKDINFEEDVVKERCFHTLPYDSKYFWEVLAIDGLVALPPKSRVPIGRHNTRGTDLRHMPCGLSKLASHQLKPLKRKIMEKAMQMHQQALKAEMKKAEEEESEQTSTSEEESIFMTELSQSERTRVPKKVVQPSQERLLKRTSSVSSEKKPKKVAHATEKELMHLEKSTSRSLESTVSVVTEPEPKAPKNDWDTYLLSILSPLTANWIVHQRMSPSEEKDNLTQVLTEWYGVPQHTDLMRDDDSVADHDSEEEEEVKKKKKKQQQQQQKKKKKKGEEGEEEEEAEEPEKEEKQMTLFEKIRAEMPKRSVDPYSDDNTAPFYRQPAGLRRQRKTLEKEEAGAINATAHSVIVKPYLPSPPPTLRDFINPAVGDTVYETDNMFQQEWLAGSRQVHLSRDNTKILMENNNKYKKHLRKEYPTQPQRWYASTEQERRAVTTDGRIERGLRRWESLPEPVDDTAETLNIVPPGYDAEFNRSPDPATRRTVKQNASLMQIIDEWRSKWYLSGQFADSDAIDLIRDMADIQPHVRLKAIATVAKAAEYKPPNEAGIQLEFQEREHDLMSKLPEETFTALNFLLDDEHDRVQKAAAITLYSLNKPSDKAEGILKDALMGDNSVDRWAAAQCLAHFGMCNSDVVGEVITQLLDTEDAVKHERAITLLAKISNNLTLVHSMVAEQLNSSSWRHKVIACKILPKLHGNINKDISNKLSELMWNDWHTDVRRAAAQCLGKTQHGRDVHNDLKTRIASTNERIRLEALTKIGDLGIMTAKILPAYLRCFEDQYVSIRIEACITASNLKIKDERVRDKLLYIATFDPIWKVKATAIQALGVTAVMTDDVRDCLIWAMRYEDMEGVRAEACHSLMQLGCSDSDFVDVIQDRLLVEPSEIVKGEMMDVLQQLGVNTTDDMDMVTQIKEEVRKLSNRNNIATHIMINEMDDHRRENLKRMIYDTDKELRRFFRDDEANHYLQVTSAEDIDEKLVKKEILPLRQRGMSKSKNQGQEVRRKSALEKIRSLNASRQRPTGARSQDSSIALSREGAMFTPTADTELEALMLTYNEENSDDMSRTSDTATAKSGGEISSVSRPETSGTVGSAPSNEDETNVLNMTVKSVSSTVPDSEGMSGEPGEERLSDGQNVPDAHLAVPESHSHLDVTSAMGYSRSVSECDSRLSIYGPKSGRRALLSRDTTMEREKILAEATATYKCLNLRYSFLDGNLDMLDRGLNSNPQPEDEQQLMKAVVSQTSIEKGSQDRPRPLPAVPSQPPASGEATMDVIPPVIIRISPETDVSSLDGEVVAANIKIPAKRDCADDLSGGTSESQASESKGDHPVEPVLIDSSLTVESEGDHPVEPVLIDIIEALSDSEHPDEASADQTRSLTGSTTDDADGSGQSDRGQVDNIPVPDIMYTSATDIDSEHSV